MTSAAKCWPGVDFAQSGRGCQCWQSGKSSLHLLLFLETFLETWDSGRWNEGAGAPPPALLSAALWSTLLFYKCTGFIGLYSNSLAIGKVSGRESEVKVAQSCLTLCDPMDYTVHGILQARILEWVAMFFSRGSSQPRDPSQVSHTAGGFLTNWAPRETQWKGRFTINSRLQTRSFPSSSPLCQALDITAGSSPWLNDWLLFYSEEQDHIISFSVLDVIALKWVKSLPKMV